MPIRKTPLVNGKIYHVYNRSVNKVPIFTNKREYARFLFLLDYYKTKNAPFCFSKFIRLKPEEQQVILDKVRNNKQNNLISLIAYCFMPNHFHLLLQQQFEEGIKDYLRKIQNSYAKYFNLKHKRQGPLFQNRYKVVLIEDEVQLLHTSRYIHLNPYSGYILKDKKELKDYPWSSLSEYLSKQEGRCEKDLILNQFSQNKYLKFVLDQADYQRSLKDIKHLALEKF